MLFNDVLRKIFRRVMRKVQTNRGFETRSFSKFARRYPSRLCLLSCSSHQLDSRMSWITAEELGPTNTRTTRTKEKASSKIFASFRVFSGQNRLRPLRLLAKANGVSFCWERARRHFRTRVRSGRAR
jgi:hypothetical protein